MNGRRGHIVFLVLFFAALASAIAWLLIGLVPALAAGSDSLHGYLHRIGAGEGVGAEMARNAAHASHTVGSGLQVVLDYLFSAFNLGLAGVLIHLRTREPAARLLALGLVGSAVAFNLQGHDALQVFPVSMMGAVGAWHLWVHIGSGLSYLFALLVFPHGRLIQSRGVFAVLRALLLVLTTLILVGLSASTADDHTTGLVILFGIAIPVVGLASQIVVYARARNEQQRQQSRLLIISLVGAGLVAIPLMIFTNVSDRAPTSQTVTYEVAIPEPGTYRFVCDPHPKMKGILVADEGVAPFAEVSARKSRFDKSFLTLPTGETSTIRFTSFDADPHNVAIYRDNALEDPIFIGQEFSGRPTGVDAFRTFRIVFALIPIVLLIDLARFRLWDINRVMNRTVAYALIAGLITVSYLAVIATVGAIFGTGQRLNLVASIVMTVVVAALFQPLRDRARKMANRIVYGNRATPYELLSEFSNKMGGRYDFQTLIPDLARILADGTGAARAEVWLRIEDVLLRAATWPEGPDPETVPVTNDDLSALEDRDRVAAVCHGDELLGALTITKPAGESVGLVEERLLADAAAQAGLAFKNVQLNAELRARLDELRASRQRLVAAQDAERRRLERDIHDGVQQNLVALSMKLGRAQELAATDPDRAQELLAELQADTGETLQALRDLARGIHPPILSDRGLTVALEAHARRCSLPVEVEGQDVGRFPTDVESAVYFCCLEAIQNAAKHSGASRVMVSLNNGAGGLVFSVSDDGKGFDRKDPQGAGLQNISDRVAALAGEVTFTSGPEGTTVEGRIPASPL